MVKPTMTAAEKRVYLNVFASAFASGSPAPYYSAYEAVVLFRQTGEKLKDKLSQSSKKALKMWEEVSTIPLGL